MLKPGDKVMIKECDGYFALGKVYTVDYVKKDAGIAWDDKYANVYIVEPGLTGKKDWHYPNVFVCVNGWSELEILLYG